MALLAVRASAVATMAALAVRGGGDRSTVDGGIGQRRQRRLCWRWWSATALTVVSMALLAVRALTVATMAALAARDDSGADGLQGR